MSSSLEVGKSSLISSMQQLSIDDWVKKLTSISERDFNIERICDFTARYGIQAETLKPYVFYANSHYTRNLIFKCDLFEILAASTIIATRIVGWSLPLAAFASRIFASNRRILLQANVKSSPPTLMTWIPRIPPSFSPTSPCTRF
jgi:hypothetical protein